MACKSFLRRSTKAERQVFALVAASCFSLRSVTAPLSVVSCLPMLYAPKFEPRTILIIEVSQQSQHALPGSYRATCAFAEIIPGLPTNALLCCGPQHGGKSLQVFGGRPSLRSSLAVGALPLWTDLREFTSFLSREMFHFCPFRLTRWGLGDVLPDQSLRNARD